ncbi:MAG: hypothetical protein ACC653_01845 [Gammaproteobacteria bacterium]
MKYINLLLLSLFVNGLLSSYFAQAGFAEEVVDIEGTSIIGNRELPKVLYIVPWKQSQLPDMDSLPIDRLVDEALAPIERKEFQRQVNFHEQLNPEKNEN